MTEEEIHDLRRWLEKSRGVADGKPFLGDRRLDAIVEVMLEMAAQSWVTRRRLAVMESLLTEVGALAPGAAESHTLPPDVASAPQDQRKAFVSAIFRAFADLPSSPAPSGLEV